MRPAYLYVFDGATFLRSFEAVKEWNDHDTL